MKLFIAALLIAYVACSNVVDESSPEEEFALAGLRSATGLETGLEVAAPDSLAQALPRKKVKKLKKLKKLKKPKKATGYKPAKATHSKLVFHKKKDKNCRRRVKIPHAKTSRRRSAKLLKKLSHFHYNKIHTTVHKHHYRRRRHHHHHHFHLGSSSSSSTTTITKKLFGYRRRRHHHYRRRRHHYRRRRHHYRRRRHHYRRRRHHYRRRRHHYRRRRHHYRRRRHHHYRRRRHHHYRRRRHFHFHSSSTTTITHHYFGYRRRRHHYRRRRHHHYRRRRHHHYRRRRHHHYRRRRHFHFHSSSSSTITKYHLHTKYHIHKHHSLWRRRRTKRLAKIHLTKKKITHITPVARRRRIAKIVAKSCRRRFTKYMNL